MGYAASEAAKAAVMTEARRGTSSSVARRAVIVGGAILE
jgi:hypothetical protein